MEEIEAVAKRAMLEELIQTKLHLGYETMVGERGLILSGGERQRYTRGLTR
jgi:ABC-type multidrug transport system fused ATPase/permease subunit